MRWWSFLLCFAVGFAATLLILIIYNTWRAKRDQRAMARHNGWRLWISRVKSELDAIEGVDSNDVMDRHAEWFHNIWLDRHTTPRAAVSAWLRQKTNRVA